MKNSGIYVNKRTDFLDEISLTNHCINLISCGDGIEIMTQEIKKGITFDVSPNKSDFCSSTLEFFYILEGELEYYQKEKNKYLTKGDYFYTKNLKTSCFFKTLSDVKLLYVSSEPVFHHLTSFYSKLSKIMKQVEEKDVYTYGHGKRVQDYCVKIALEMGLNRELIADISMAGLFHDIGKYYIPDSVLKKESSLTKEEFELMKSHPIRGLELVEEIKYKDIGKLVEQHHERIDGSGYPYGITGDEICLGAKIIAVADSFDAMTSDRPYRKGLSKTEALKELEDLSGIHYDEKVIEAFKFVITKKI